MPDSFQNGLPPVSAGARTPKTWDFMETTFVALIDHAVFWLTGGFGAAIILAMQDGVEKLTPAQFQELVTQERWGGVAEVIAFLPTMAVLWIAIRMAGRKFTEYLALNWPSRNELLLAFGVIATVMVVQAAFGSYGPTANSPIVAGGGAGGLFVLLVGGCIAAPIMEEFLFRGFMFRGWSESFLGPIGAVVLTSVLFGLFHFQYDWVERVWVCVFGLVLCTFRWRTNSTWLTVVVHSAVNIFVFFTAGSYV